MTTSLPAIVDLRSDTVTRPTPAMRRAIAEAVVGGLRKRRRTVWVPGILRPVFAVFRHLPGAVWRRLPLG